MLTVEQIRLRLRDRNLQKVAELTGVGYATILRLMRGRMASYTTLKRLADYLEERP